jgi:fucose permease
MMSVIGGGISPCVMGRIADNYSTSLAYVIPLLSFVAIFVCGLYFCNEEAN